jgi:hypothetical protein
VRARGDHINRTGAKKSARSATLALYLPCRYRLLTASVGWQLLGYGWTCVGLITRFGPLDVAAAPTLDPVVQPTGDLTRFDIIGNDGEPWRVVPSLNCNGHYAGLTRYRFPAVGALSCWPYF